MVSIVLDYIEGHGRVVLTEYEKSGNNPLYAASVLITTVCAFAVVSMSGISTFLISGPNYNFGMGVLVGVVIPAVIALLGVVIAAYLFVRTSTAYRVRIANESTTFAKTGNADEDARNIFNAVKKIKETLQRKDQRRKELEELAGRCG